ncbi:MAG: M28 family metallopeptidase, partial [Actinomycetota bacterium]|nr:M28 family metallopeptidase [Actinomycetota bacterium]
LEPAPNRSAQAALSAAEALGYRASYLQDSGLSDHAELTRGGLPAAWITWRWDTCWHRACDTADRVSARKLAAAAHLTLAAVRRARSP